MLMSILAFIKLKNISTTHRLKRNHVIQHQRLVAALAEKSKQTETKCQTKVAIQHQQVLNICIKMSFQIPNPLFF